VLGIPEEARMKKRSRSVEFSTKIGDEQPAKMRIEPTNRMHKIGITAPTRQFFEFNKATLVMWQQKWRS